jgi:hypothetical protein
MGLEEYEPKREVDVQDGSGDISLSLPLHSVSLLVLHGSAAA